MRKNFSVFFIAVAFILSCSIFFGYTLINKAFADKGNVNLKTSGKSSILIDADSGKIIYAENENSAYPIASMCKIMTLLLAFESVDCGELSYDDTVIVSENAAGMGGSQVFLEANAEYSVSELLKSITVASANDASVAVAEKICGNEELFVEKMNEKAKALGMNNTIFVNCTGLPKSGQYSTAKDVSVMFSELIKHKGYFNYSCVWMDEINHPKGRITQISNTNKLIRFYKGCDGGKTGYTSEAGHCLCATAERNGLRLIAVEISAPDGKTRFKDVSSMFDYGFAGYENKILVSADKPLNFTVEVKGGKTATVAVIGEKDLKRFSVKGEKVSVEFDFKPIENIKAPVKSGDILGTLNVYENGVKLGSVLVLAAQDVAAKTYSDVISDVAANWSLIG